MGVVTLTNYEDIARIKIISSYQERIRDISNSNNGCLKPGYIFDLAIFYTYLICLLSLNNQQNYQCLEQ